MDDDDVMELMVPSREWNGAHPMMREENDADVTADCNCDNHPHHRRHHRVDNAVANDYSYH